MDRPINKKKWLKCGFLKKFFIINAHCKRKKGVQLARGAFVINDLNELKKNFENLQTKLTDDVS